MPTVEEIKKADPQGFAALRSEVEKEFQEKLDAAQAEAKKLSVVNDALKSRFEEQGKQIVALQTQFSAVQREAVLKDAKAELAKAFDESKVPETAVGKAVEMFNFTKFFKDDGAFDKDAFSKAMAEDVASWEKMFEGVTVVKGGGATGSFSKSVDSASDDTGAFSADAKAAQARMLKMIGKSADKE